MARAWAIDKKQRVFALGLREEQVTVYRQQVRALNLAYLLHERSKDSSGKSQPTKVGIVGAGACGVTLSAALLLLGHEVVLFERQAEMMYLQKGCETRYLHPNNYDWPNVGSDIPFADLPFLSWRAATAASVCRQILQKFERIRYLSGVGENFTYHPRSLVKVKSRDLKIEWQSLDGGEQFSGEKKNGQRTSHAGTDPFDYIVLCVGFGIEDDVDDEKHFSYWRNDSFNQTRANSYAASRTEYWVSGSGDGALIDVQRLTIRDYDQSGFLFDVWSKAPSGESISNVSLREFRERVLANVYEFKGPETEALYEAIEEEASSDVIQVLDRYLSEKKRVDTFVVLNNSQPTFKRAIGIGKRSFLNALVCHRLYNRGAFVYLGGEMDKRDGEWGHPMRRHHPSCKLIIRHGANRDHNLKECGVTPPRSKPDATVDINKLSSRQWAVGWWQSNVIDEARQVVSGNATDRVEFFSPDIQTLCEPYVSGLSGLIANSSAVSINESNAPPEYRVCMHRVVQIQDGGYFQQITNYAGTAIASKGLVGRVFDLHSGIAGLACVLGKTVIVEIPGGDELTAKMQTEVSDLWKSLRLAGSDNLGGMRSPPKYARSYAAVPIFLGLDNEGLRHKKQKQKIGFILYLDSSSDLFEFKNNNVTVERMLEFIGTAFLPFRENLATMVKERRAFFSELPDVPVPQWDEAAGLVKKFKSYLRVQDSQLALPSEIFPEVTLNRFQEGVYTS